MLYASKSSHKQPLCVQINLYSLFKAKSSIWLSLCFYFFSLKTYCVVLLLQNWYKSLPPPWIIVYSKSRCIFKKTLNLLTEIKSNSKLGDRLAFSEIHGKNLGGTKLQYCLPLGITNHKSNSNKILEWLKDHKIL